MCEKFLSQIKPDRVKITFDIVLLNARHLNLVPADHSPAMAELAEEKYELITRRLQEVLGGDLIKAILAEGRTPKCYWGRPRDTDRFRDISD